MARLNRFWLACRACLWVVVLTGCGMGSAPNAVDQPTVDLPSLVTLPDGVEAGRTGTQLPQMFGTALRSPDVHDVRFLRAGEASGGLTIWRYASADDATVAYGLMETLLQGEALSDVAQDVPGIGDAAAAAAVGPLGSTADLVVRCGALVTYVRLAGDLADLLAYGRMVVSGFGSC